MGKHRKKGFSSYIGRYIIVLTSWVILTALLVGISAPLVDSYEYPVLPSSFNTKITVILDPGHGGEDGGAIGINGTPEKDLNLSIALFMKDLLSAAGVPVVLTREDDRMLYDPQSDYHGHKKTQDLANRRRIAEQYPSAIFVSIHMNAFTESKYSGIQIYFSKNSENSYLLAEQIRADSVNTVQPSNTRKCKQGGEIYLLKHLSCPAVLIECGFLSNPTECAMLCDEEYRRDLSVSFSSSILCYLYQNGS